MEIVSVATRLRSQIPSFPFSHRADYGGRNRRPTWQGSQLKKKGLSVRTTDYDEHALHANPHLHYGTPTFSPTVDRPGEGVGALSSRHMAPLSPPS
ncbi:hypothetical protein M0657_002160 [Pyricularia oryzae]|nr:hypothetical protein M9X92_004118 [Pyricularia oryzae]KAI7929482.1 hypothetical protein M0657_002160 [Pyricularia oryzae]